MSATGGCLCGAVRFVAREALGPGGYCHCEDCRRCTGGAFNLSVRCSADGFEILQGAPKGFTKAGDSGQLLTRWFCGDCGSPLYTSSPRHPEAVYLKAGVLDDPSLVKPAHQAWTSRRVAWSTIPDDLPAFEHSRPRPNPIPAAVDIRRFEPADEAGVIAVILPIQREEFGFEITVDDQPDLRAIADFYQTGAGDFWVAEAAGEVVGVIGLKDIGAGQAALRKMFVASGHRGGAPGVAARLLGRLLETARSRGLGAIYLGTTDRFLAAHRFYEKHGFRRIEPEALPASFPRMALDTRFYVLDL
jgi:N-acetylglutamate synthase-like GNAT family acetyltransferase